HRLRCEGASISDITAGWSPGMTLSTAPLDQLPDSINRCRWIGPMDHRMTVRAQGNEVAPRIQNIRFANRTERTQVVHMNKASADIAVNGFEIKVAGGASTTMCRNANLACHGVSLIGVDRHALDGPLKDCGR